MSNLAPRPGEFIPAKRAPEVFLVLNTLFRPVPVPESNLPDIEVKPYIPAARQPQASEEVIEVAS